MVAPAAPVRIEEEPMTEPTKVELFVPDAQLPRPMREPL